LTPLGEFVEPGGRELRPAQALVIFRGEHLRHRAVFPFQTSARRLPFWLLAVAVHREQSGDALHHHVANVLLGFADQRDTRLGVAQRQAAHPFGAGPRFARAAAAEDEPGGPGPAVVAELWRLLMMVREEAEVVEQSAPSIRRNLRQYAPLFAGAQRE
jgi:hypothetical protein